jgi:hypothetical protein
VGFEIFFMSNFIEEVSKQFDAVVIYCPKEVPIKINAFKYCCNQSGDIHRIQIDMVLEMERNVAHLQNTTLLWHEDNLVSGYPKSNSARSLLVKGIYLFTRFITFRCKSVAENCNFIVF